MHFLSFKKHENKNKQKIGWQKITKTKPNQKHIQKICGVLFSLPTIHGCHKAYTGVWLIYPVTLYWKKTDFPFPSRHQLQIVSWLRVGLLCLNAKIFALFNPVHALCVLSIVTVSVNLYWKSPVVSGRICFLGVIHHLWLLQCFCLFFHIDLWALRECSKLSHSLHIIHLWVFVNYCLLQEA